MECAHLDQIQVTELPEKIAGCEECLKTGDRWLHLRMCETCGKIGCCDSSPNRHASPTGPSGSARPTRTIRTQCRPTRVTSSSATSRAAAIVGAAAVKSATAWPGRTLTINAIGGPRSTWTMTGTARVAPLGV